MSNEKLTTSSLHIPGYGRLRFPIFPLLLLGGCAVRPPLGEPDLPGHGAPHRVDDVALHAPVPVHLFVMLGRVQARAVVLIEVFDVYAARLVHADDL